MHLKCKEYTIMLIPENLDLKFDYTCAEQWSDYEFDNAIHFVLKLNAVNYPVTITFVGNLPFHFVRGLIDENNNCIDGSFAAFNPGIDIDTLYIFQNDEENNLIAFNATFVTDVQEYYPDTLTSPPSPILYPNPSDDFITLKLNHTSKSIEQEQIIKVFDIKGNQIREIQLQGTEVKIYIKDLPNGVYYIQTGSKSSVKMIVNH